MITRNLHVIFMKSFFLSFFFLSSPSVFSLFCLTLGPDRLFLKSMFWHFPLCFNLNYCCLIFSTLLMFHLIGVARLVTVTGNGYHYIIALLLSSFFFTEPFHGVIIARDFWTFTVAGSRSVWWVPILFILVVTAVSVLVAMMALAARPSTRKSSRR